MTTHTLLGAVLGTFFAVSCVSTTPSIEKSTFSSGESLSDEPHQRLVTGSSTASYVGEGAPRYDLAQRYDREIDGKKAAYQGAVLFAAGGAAYLGTKALDGTAAAMAKVMESGGGGGTSTPTSGSGSGGASRPQETEELSRFRARWRGRTANFTVVSENGGSLMGTTKIVVQDPDSGKKFSLSYTYGIGEGIADANQPSFVGSTLSIRFNSEGTPTSVKNPVTGRSLSTNIDWRVTGYGW